MFLQMVAERCSCMDTLAELGQQPNQYVFADGCRKMFLDTLAELGQQLNRYVSADGCRKMFLG